MSMVGKLSYLKRRDRLTTDDIAQRSGLPLGTLNKIFAGQTRNPALLTMDSICRVFNVPIRYVLDDTVDDDCDVTAYAQDHGMFLMSECERELFLLYRAIPEQEQRSLRAFADLFFSLLPVRDHYCRERLIPCYEPIAMGRTGIFLDAWQIDTVSVDLDSITSEADFVFVVPFDIHDSFYCRGTVLAIQRRECFNQELGLFLVNGEGYFRRRCVRRGQVYLTSLKSGEKDIQIMPEDNVRALGAVLGTIHGIRYL